MDGRVSAGNRKDGQGPESSNQSTKHVSYLDGFNGALSESQPIGRHGETATRRLLLLFRRLSVSPRLSVSVSPYHPIAVSSFFFTDSG